MSLTVANRYIELRSLPDGHVLWLEDIPVNSQFGVDSFRKVLLEPAFERTRETGLAGQIDLVTYSTGFPYAVRFSGDERSHKLKANKHRGSAGSLTGMTYLAPEVMAESARYLVKQFNGYFRRPLGHGPEVLRGDTRERPGAVGEVRIPTLDFEHCRGFRARYAWGRGESAEKLAGTDHYVLSAMLGYTGLRGNSVPEILGYLERAAESDGTQPEGTVYLMDNEDIRSRVRRHLFESVRSALAKRGRRAEILSAAVPGQDGIVPVGRRDVIGLVAGTKTFDWPASGSHFLPGAIAESFTSYGAFFDYRGQTKLSAFLKAGAAGSSGAVQEPYALIEKFPLPQLHVHYADGCSLAESFYQSVMAPYQLLIVGDPLAQPFAKFAPPSLNAPTSGTPWKGRVVLEARADRADRASSDGVEVWIDGRFTGVTDVDGTVEIDSTRLSDGAHELRLVAVDPGPVETRSTRRYWIETDNRGARVAIENMVDAVNFGDQIAIEGSVKGADVVVVSHLGRRLAQAAVRDGRWRALVDSGRLGMGRVQLQALAMDGGREIARSQRHALQVTLPSLLAGERRQVSGPPGLEAVVIGVDGSRSRHTIAGLEGRMPREIALRKAARFVVSGMVEARASGLYELRVEAVGEMTLTVGKEVVWRGILSPATNGARIAVPLAAGWHRVQLAFEGLRSHGVAADLAGPEAAFALAGDRVRIE